MNLPLSSDPLPPPEDQLTATEAAALTRVSLKSVYRWVHRGRIRAWRVGARLRLSREEILAACRQVEPRSAAPARRPGPARREAEKRRAEEECRRLGIC